MVAAAGATLVGLATVIGSSLDLWDLVAGPSGDPTGSVEVTHSTTSAPRPSPSPGPTIGDRSHWRVQDTECRGPITGDGPPPVLTREPLDDESFEPGGGEVGLDLALPVGLVWVHEQVVDVPPASFSLPEFIEAGAYEAGPRKVHVLISNRTDENLVVTGISVDVERREVPTGTMALRGAGGGAELTVLAFDLGEPRPVAYGIDDDCGHSAPFFDEYVFEVDAGTSEVLHLLLEPADCLCLTRLHMEYGHAGQWKSVAVPPVGQEPIPVVAAGPDYRYDLVYADDRFDEPPQPEKYDCRRESHDAYC